MPDEEKQWYELVKDNFLKPGSATEKVVRTVRGLGYAQRMSDVLTDRLAREEKEAGFAVYLRKGSKPPGTNKARKGLDKRPSRRR